MGQHLQSVRDGVEQHTENAWSYDLESGPQLAFWPTLFLQDLL
jgi:hypothetical protein